MTKTPIYNENGEIIGETVSYENKHDCSDDTNHNMEYSVVAGVIGGKCRDCGYSTM